MEIKIDDYIIVVISSANESEYRLLRNLLNNPKADWENVCYIAMNSCSNKIISNTYDTNTNAIPPNGLFLLVNPSCLNNVGEGEYVFCNIVKSLFDSEEIKKKDFVLWLHEDDTINETIMKTLNDLTKPIKFHHDNNSNPDETEKNQPPEVFMFNVCKNGQDNFEQEFRKLIECSLKRKYSPHIIALSIRCQGYLAAHENIDNPEVKEETEKQKWWYPNIKEVSDLKSKISKELEPFGKDVEDIQLIKSIIDEKNKYFDGNNKLRDEKIEEFTSNVNGANAKLIEILTGE